MARPDVELIGTDSYLQALHARAPLRTRSA